MVCVQLIITKYFANPLPPPRCLILLILMWYRVNFSAFPQLSSHSRNYDIIIYFVRDQHWWVRVRFKSMSLYSSCVYSITLSQLTPTVRCVPWIHLTVRFIVWFEWTPFDGGGKRLCMQVVQNFRLFVFRESHYGYLVGEFLLFLYIFTIILSQCGRLEVGLHLFWKDSPTIYDSFHLRTSQVAEAKFKTHIIFHFCHRLEPKPSFCCVQVESGCITDIWRKQLTTTRLWARGPASSRGSNWSVKRNNKSSCYWASYRLISLPRWVPRELWGRE